MKMEFFALAKQQFLKDYHLKEFPKEEICIKESEPFDKEAMKYLKGTPFLNFVYFGSNLFISADAHIIDFAYQYALKTKPNLFRVFDAPNVFYLNTILEKQGYTIAYLAQYFLPNSSFQRTEDYHYNLRILKDDEIEILYGIPHFSMALCGTTKKERRDCIAVICEHDEQIVGVAAASNDGNDLWNIGVDVVPTYRHKGIGTELVIRLKEEILQLGKCPFYCCAWSNIASKRLASKAGFIDAWVELAAKPIEEEWIQKIRN